MANMKPVVLGSTGCVGQALARIAPGGAYWQHRAGRTVPGQPAVLWDILSDRAPAMQGISGVISLSRGPDTQTEIALATAACDLGARLGVPVLVASSQAVYGSGPSGPGGWSEEDPCAPTTDYGRQKLEMERHIAGRAICLRIGNVVGCDMLLKTAARGSVSLDQLADGTGPKRAYISAQNLWQVMTDLLAHADPVPSVINVAQPGQIDMADLLRAAGTNWRWTKAGPNTLATLPLDLTHLQSLVPLPRATPAGLIQHARGAGWAPA